MSNVSFVLNRYPFLPWLLVQKGITDPLLIDSAQLKSFKQSLLKRRPRRTIDSAGYEDFEEIFFVSLPAERTSWKVLTTVKQTVWKAERDLGGTFREIEAGEQLSDALARVEQAQLSFIVSVSSFTNAVSCSFHHDRVVIEPVRSLSITLYPWSLRASIEAQPCQSLLKGVA